MISPTAEAPATFVLYTGVRLPSDEVFGFVGMCTTMAHAILRHNGVDLGKMDYIGSMPVQEG